MASPELLDWCRRGGVQWDGIEAGYVGEGWRGVVATRDLAAVTCVLRVPQRLLMTASSARRDPQLSAALKALGVQLTSEQVLAAHLLHECSKGPASFWHPYLRSLPRSYTTAMCFSEAEAEALQVPHAVACARAAGAAADAQHAGAAPLLRALGLAPSWRGRGAWLWAASTLSSRTMYLAGDPAGALTPFGDLHNYRPPPPPFAPTLPGLLAAAAGLHVAESGGPGPAAPARAATGASAAPAAATGDYIAGDGSLDEGSGEYHIYARAGVEAGQQVFLCYGRHTNLELLQHYGFVLADNPHDTAALPPRLLPAAVRQQLGCNDGGGGGGAAGSREGEDTPGAAYLHATDGAPSWDLLRALRLACATPAARKAGAYLALSDRPISAASERAAFQALQGACRAALAELPTTAAQDERELASLDAGGAAGGKQPAGQDAAQAAERLHVVALEWRLCHKRVLGRGEALCDAVLAALPPAPNAGRALPANMASLAVSKPRW